MTKININETDRIILKNSERRVVSGDALGYVFSRPGHSVELHEQFTHEEIVKLIDAGELRIDRKWYDETRAKARLMAGVDSLTELKVPEANELLRREYYVSQFLAMEAADKQVKRTDVSIKRAIIEIELNRPTSGQRCDRNVTAKCAPSPRTFRRWLKNYEDGGGNVVALRTRHRFSGNKNSKIDAEVHKLLTKYAMQYCSETRPTVSKLHGKLSAELALINRISEANGEPLLVCPSKATLQRRVNQLNQFEVHACRHGINSARARFAVVGTGLDVTRPLQHVQIDTLTIPLHTIVNDWGLDKYLTVEERKELQTERKKICLAFDVATRGVLAFRVSDKDDANNAIAVLAMSVSDKNAIAKAAGCKSDWPHRGPGSLYSPDAGSPFIDTRFRGCIAKLKAVYENAPAALSSMRGHIERVFGTTHTMLLPEFPGRAFSNTQEKGEYEAHKRASIFSDKLPMILTRFFVDIYHHTPHEGLMGETPYNAWHRLVGLYGLAPCPDLHARRDIFGEPLARNLDPRGIRVNGNFYQSDAIQEWRREVGDTKLDIRYDTADIGHISAWFDDQWNVVPAVRTSLVGVDLNVWMRTVADLRRRFAAGAKVNEHIVHDAIRAISEIADDSVCRTAIAGLRPDAAEIDRTEESLTLGFDIVADNVGEQKSADGIIGTEFPATPASVPLSPPSVTAPANSAKASTKPASVTLAPAPRNLPSLED
ncbi:Mu transposase C-terminal domain-containing protein [Tardiphaga sp. 11_C7_N12_6]|uniref:Mu transposase C-terminal domain-containing protein n=1 Tax=Tardiphaga sp. 11_C7_N12_6 TaxID=3240789 RepID=UPI003F226621